MAASARAERGAALRAQALPARLASGVLLGGLAVFGAWRGGWLFDGLLGVVLLAGLVEFLRMARSAGHPVLLGTGSALGVAILLYALAPGIPGKEAVLVALAVVLLAGTLRPPIAGRAVGLALTLLGAVYVLGLGLHLHRLRQEPDGAALVLAVLLGTWAADTAAFFVGLRWGRRSLAPSISPAKSVEGLLAGIVASTAVTAGVVGGLDPARGWAVALGLGGAVAVGAPLGDLFESFLKRSFQVKDASHLIPGHGGMLDRVDSLLLAGAAAATLLRFLEP